MPKNSRSARRTPLADVSNSRKASRSRKEEALEEDGVGGRRGRLLLARANLSKVSNQIDELVKQALKQKLVHEKERQEIECFIRTLSDVHSSLKSWVPRLQRAFGNSTRRGGNNVGEDLADKSSPAIAREGRAPDDPNESDQSLVVSPSPLVSWPNGTCTVETGRQLFLLTPLHKSKAGAPKSSGSPRSSVGGSSIKHSSRTTLQAPTLSHPANSTCNVLVGKLSTVPTPNKFLMPRTKVSGSSSESGLVAPDKTLTCKDQFVFCLTPCLKTPAPKPLLDSILESFQEDNMDIRNDICSVSNNSNSNQCPDNSSSDDVSKTLASKFPELFRLQPAAVQMNEVEERLHWFLSPPKTCVLMEPPDEKFPPASELNKNFLNSGLKTLCPAAAEDTTPMWKDFGTATGNGKKAGEATLKREQWTRFEDTPTWKDFGTATGNGKKAGETTLKRELWTRFEAVSAHSLRFDPSIFKHGSRKQLIDMLEDVS